jgi:hypothetical protein
MFRNAGVAWEGEIVERFVLRWDWEFLTRCGLQRSMTFVMARPRGSLCSMPQGCSVDGGLGLPLSRLLLLDTVSIFRRHFDIEVYGASNGFAGCTFPRACEGCP